MDKWNQKSINEGIEEQPKKKRFKRKTKQEEEKKIEEETKVEEIQLEIDEPREDTTSLNNLALPQINTGGKKKKKKKVIVT